MSVRVKHGRQKSRARETSGTARFGLLGILLVGVTVVDLAAASSVNSEVPVATPLYPHTCVPAKELFAYLKKSANKYL